LRERVEDYLEALSDIIAAIIFVGPDAPYGGAVQSNIFLNRANKALVIHDPTL